MALQSFAFGCSILDPLDHDIQPVEFDDAHDVAIGELGAGAAHGPPRSIDERLRPTRWRLADVAYLPEQHTWTAEARRFPTRPTHQLPGHDHGTEDDGGDGRDDCQAHLEPGHVPNQEDPAQHERA